MAFQLPYAFAKQFSLVFDGVSLLQTAKTPLAALQEAQRVLGPFTLLEVTPEELEKQLQIRYQSGADSALDIVSSIDNGEEFLPLADALPQAEELLDSQDSAPVIRLLNAIIAEAIREEASDIHIEPNETCVRVRLRKDGVLQTVIEPKRELAPLLSSRIKIMAKLDIAERRLPQDGRMGIQYAGRPVDIRVSIIPSGLGERIVLRLLDRQSGRLNLDYLGMPRAIHDSVNQLIQRPHGIILVTGPTGSGKTTTLYAALQQINQDSRNIMTIEDPVEYDLNGISQTAVNTQTGMTFANGLRSILRQDPNVIMVGEIRDLETAKIAVQASLTGHLVFSTVHTNTAAGTITRLQDMGVEPCLL
jgi:general secretion pathway protein E